MMDYFDEPPRVQDRIWGVVSGLVTNNQDPDGLGRVKVKIPQFSEADESNWARVSGLMAGKERGAYFLPEVNDEVLVAFELGDINRPYVIGALWNGMDKPPQTNSDGKNNQRVIKSRSGHTICFDDQEGQEKITIADKSGKNQIEFDTKNNSITICSAKDIIFSAQNGKIALKGMEIEVVANEELNLKATGNTNVKGALINLN